MVVSACGSVGVGCSNHGSSPEIHILRKCFQCGGWGLVSNLKEHHDRQLADMGVGCSHTLLEQQGVGRLKHTGFSGPTDQTGHGVGWV